MPLSEPGGFFEQTQTNQIIGNSSGEDNTGDNVFFVGQNAGDNNIADDVIGIGTGAADQNEAPNAVVIGNRNYPIGPLSQNDGVIMIGHDIWTGLPQNTNIVRNIAIGSGIDASSTSGFTRNNVLIGVDVLQGAALGGTQSSTIIGAAAAELANNNPVSNATLVGAFAGRTTGAVAATPNACTYMGDGAGENQVSGPNNTAVGDNAMGDGSISGQTNTALGSQAAEDLSSGIDNTIIGAMASGGPTSQDENVIVGSWNGADYDSSSEGNVMIGASVSNSGVTTGVGSIVIGRHAGQTGFTAALSQFVLEGAPSGLNTPERAIPFLAGDLENANLILGMHAAAVTGNAVDRAYGNGSCTLIIQDADAGGGGGGAITGGLTNAAGIFYDSSIGVNGELRAIDPAGTVVTLAIF